MTAPTKPRGFTEEAINELIAQRNEPAWMTERRRTAWTAWNDLPMPDPRKDEEWRRTPLRLLELDEATPLSDAAKANVVPLAPAGELAAALTFVDGQVTARQDIADDLRQQGVIVTDLRSALAEHADLVQRYFMTVVKPTEAKFAALHGAFWDNGVFVYVPKGVAVALPVGVVVESAAPGRASLHHTLIVMERDSSLKYVEELRGGVAATADGQAFSSRVIELVQGDGTTLDFATIQRFSPAMFDFYDARVVQARDTNFTLHNIELGAAMSKGHIEALLEGAGAHARLAGIYFADHDQHLDRYTLQDHKGINTTSDLLFKGVVADTARSVYSGYIRIHPGAKGSRAYQQNRNIQLSRKARADSNPSLEIAENDILGCTHGATVGKVDEEQLFYLMCRGLSRGEATQMIVEGFLDQLVEAIPLPTLRVSLRDELIARVEATTVETDAA
ncbi:MAG: Fe-S cluster assembly protein SufD [Ktedonobacterales bacterium]|nr:Fe-S cluster assembly protein SufD [Ktedonobacterales bacterium]